MMEDLRMVVAASYPELMDLVNEGRLVLVGKRQFGPVPEWRTEFVEPEAVWLVGTSHVSQKSVADVERVIRSLRPDNVVVELCRSSFLHGLMKRSKAVNNSKRVVGVIGNGHMNGVVYALVSGQGNLRFRDIAGSKSDGGSNRWVSSLLTNLVRDTILGFILWAVYELLQKKLPISGLF